MQKQINPAFSVLAASNKTTPITPYCDIIPLNLLENGLIINELFARDPAF
jgi:hypothetical protein